MRPYKMKALAIGLLAMMGGLARADGVDDYLKSEMAKRHIPGLTVAVVRDGKVVKQQGYGLADVEASAPATAGTVYMLASMSKQFTATGIMLLVQDGKVGLDDAAGKYLDGLPETWRGVTVRQLLNQTSGIPEWNPDADKDPLLRAYTLTEISERASAKPLAFKPGTRFEYSNTNYNLLAGVIEKASGKPYGDFLQARIFRPLGMSETGLYDPLEIVRGRAAGYVRAGGRLFHNPFIYAPSFLAGMGGLQSTAGDLVKWDAALASGTVLPASSLRQMWTPPALPGGAHTDYGMGWITQTSQGHRLIWHNGTLPGAMSFIGRWPEDRLTVIVLSNMKPLDGFDDAYPFLPLGQGVAALYVPALAPAKEAAAVDDPAVTKMLRQVLIDLAAGKADAPQFTPNMNALLTPALIAQTDRNLSAAGVFKPETLTLVGQTQENGLRVYRYRARYGETPVIWTVSLTAGGLIAGLVPKGQ